ncbi:unnamed protein product [Cylindrotheca closterium]|uniref:NFACT RNA-binding domain-containing protein n=1 Tax=Cylindrotheca closterium TaxID=2856 RepID=A0AAD2G8E9_9STRA|nr:unnamed protein product [Cylindrotheca closterium]CAJ1966634.1 unnamed protein product [Cylindrotheca closterium]
MVYYFTSLCGEFMIYMGKDKYENDELIKYGLPEDVWFHVDNLSSAHVYLRMKPGMSMDDISDDLIEQCSSLCKANSIAGCKKPSVHIVYTRWKNLKKTAGMVEGQVTYHRPENVRRVKIEKNVPIVKQLERTRKELFPDLEKEQERREKEIQRQKKNEYKKLASEKKKQQAEAQRDKELRSYDRLYDEAYMTRASDQHATVDATAAEEFEDDFM